MTDANPDWEKRSAELWATIDDHDEEEFVARIDRLAAELPAGSAIRLFERAAAFDSTGHPDLAVPLYRAALEAGLGGSAAGAQSFRCQARCGISDILRTRSRCSPRNSTASTIR